MNKAYETAEVIVIKVEEEDILTASKPDRGDWDLNSSSLFPN